MALTKDDIIYKYPLPVYNYKVTVDSKEMAFSEVSGLDITYGEVILYKHGLSFMEGEFIQSINSTETQKQKPATITLRKGMIRGEDTLYQWIHNHWVNTVLPMTISLCDEEGNPLIYWDIKRAVPVRLSAPAFNAEANEVAIQSMEVFAKDIKIIYEK